MIIWPSFRSSSLYAWQVLWWYHHLLLVLFVHFLIMSNNQSHQDQSLNIHNPFYLHPRENPAIALVSPMLDSANYNSWSRSILTALSAKNKVEFVDDSIKRYASNHALHTVWKRCDHRVVYWLVHSVSPSIRQSILWMDDARDIWKDLKSRYSQGDMPRIYELQ